MALSQSTQKSKRKGQLEKRIEAAYKAFRQTRNLRHFAETMARIGDVRYQWQANAVLHRIQQIIPEPRRRKHETT